MGLVGEEATWEPVSRILLLYDRRCSGCVEARIEKTEISNRGTERIEGTMRVFGMTITKGHSDEQIQIGQRKRKKREGKAMEMIGSSSTSAGMGFIKSRSQIRFDCASLGGSVAHRYCLNSIDRCYVRGNALLQLGKYVGEESVGSCIIEPLAKDLMRDVLQRKLWQIIGKHSFCHSLE